MSSDHTKIDTALSRPFDEQGHRIVSWNDPDREFQNDLWLLKRENVQVVRLDQVGSLEAKIRSAAFGRIGRHCSSTNLG